MRLAANCSASCQGFDGIVQDGCRVPLQVSACVGNELFDCRALSCIQKVAVGIQCCFRRLNRPSGLDLFFFQGAQLHVAFGIFSGFLKHFDDFRIGQAVGWLDGDGCFRT